jgi:hypothetical protein
MSIIEKRVYGLEYQCPVRRINYKFKIEITNSHDKKLDDIPMKQKAQSVIREQFYIYVSFEKVLNMRLNSYKQTVMESPSQFEVAITQLAPDSTELLFEPKPLYG